MLRIAFQKKLEQRAVSGLYLLYGSESYLLDFVTRYLKEDYLGEMSALNFTELTLEENNQVQILEAAETLPVFSAQRILLIKNCDFTKDGMGKYKTVYDALYDYMDTLPESLLLIMIAPHDTIFKGKFVKKVDAADRLVSFQKLDESDLNAFITRRVQRTGKKITTGAVRLLGTRSLYLDPHAKKNLYDVDHILTSLIAEEKGTITEESVAFMLPAPFTETIFQLMDAVSQKRSHEALRIYQSVRQGGIDVFGVFYMLVRHVRNLIRVKAYLENPKNPSGPKYLSLSPFEYGKLAKSARDFSYRTLYRMMRYLYHTESNLKRSPVEKDTLLTVLVMQLCEESK